MQQKISLKNLLKDNGIYHIGAKYINDAPTLLVICGPSGSGKSTFEKVLLDTYPDKFSKLPQVTTRKPRPGETNADYLFINENEYNKMKSKLIARICSTNDYNGTKYGTLPLLNRNSINTVIAAAPAIEDIFCNNRKTILPTLTKIVMVMIDIDYKNIPDFAKREGRDKEFFLNEQKNIYNAFSLYKPFASYSFYYKITKTNNGLKYPTILDIFEIDDE